MENLCTLFLSLHGPWFDSARLCSPCVSLRFSSFHHQSENMLRSGCPIPIYPSMSIPTLFPLYSHALCPRRSWQGSNSYSGINMITHSLILRKFYTITFFIPRTQKLKHRYSIFICMEKKERYKKERKSPSYIKVSSWRRHPLFVKLNPAEESCLFLTCLWWLKVHINCLLLCADKISSWLIQRVSEAMITRPETVMTCQRPAYTRNWKTVQRSMVTFHFIFFMI